MRKMGLGLLLLAEMGLRYCVSPYLRARVLRLLGARIGRNVRIYECRFINLEKGFRNLSLGDDVHVGTDCLIDLKGEVVVGRGTSLSPRVTIISHVDPGSAHASPLLQRYPVEERRVQIGEHCWLGAGTTVLSGTQIGDRCVVGAMALARGELQADSTYVGVPVRKLPLASSQRG